LLALANYNLEVTHFPGLEGSALQIRNLEAWKGKPEQESSLRGAVSFRPVGRKLPFHDAVWILSSASFGADMKTNPVVISQLAPVQGCFYYGHGCFWLQNLV